MKFVAIVFLAPILLSSIAWGESLRRDGNLWMQLSDSGKSSYVIGFLDGATETHRRDDKIDVMTLESPLKTPDGAYKLLQYVDAAAKARLAAQNEFANIEVGQFTDGLDKFYADYRNRLIQISHAMFLVAESIKGTSSEKIEEEVALYRKKDSQ